MLSSLKSVCQRPKALAPRNARRSLVCRAEAEEAPKAPVVKREIPEARGILGIGGSTAAAAYVDAALPGNWGFDPLGISDPEGAGGAIDPEWLGYAEIIH